jgi:hypothetical protein
VQQLGLVRGPVAETTLRRLFARLDADRLDALLGTWAAARAALVEGRRVIAIDGKTVRGARGGDASHWSRRPRTVGSGARRGAALRRGGSGDAGCRALLPQRGASWKAFAAPCADRRAVGPARAEARAGVRHSFSGCGGQRLRAAARPGRVRRMRLTTLVRKGLAAAALAASLSGCATVQPAGPARSPARGFGGPEAALHSARPAVSGPPQGVSRLFRVGRAAPTARVTGPGSTIRSPARPVAVPPAPRTQGSTRPAPAARRRVRRAPALPHRFQDLRGTGVLNAGKGYGMRQLCGDATAVAPGAAAMCRDAYGG